MSNEAKSHPLTKLTLPKTRKDLEKARGQQSKTVFDYVGTPGIQIAVLNHMCRRSQEMSSAEVLQAELWFECMDDFGPSHIVECLPALRNLLDEPHGSKPEIPGILSTQVNEILHHPEFQSLEASWRGLEYLLEYSENRYIDPRENANGERTVNRDEMHWIMSDLQRATKEHFEPLVAIEVIHATKHDLLSTIREVERSSELSSKLLLFHSAERVQRDRPTRARPCLAMIADYEFTPHVNDPDAFLLERLCAAAAIAHAPIISAIGPNAFGAKSFAELSQDPTYWDDRCAYDSSYGWREFRKARESSYCILTLPRIRLRNPYLDHTSPRTNWKHTETLAKVSDYLWSNAAYAIGTCMITAYAQRGWCLEMHGLRNGRVPGLQPHSPIAENAFFKTVPPIEGLLSRSAGAALSKQGFAVLEYDRGTGAAVFWKIPTLYEIESPKSSDQQRVCSPEALTSRELEHLLVACQIAHSIEGMQWQNKGRSSIELQHEVAAWIEQYVDHPGKGRRNLQFPYSSTLPLARTMVQVRDVEGNPGTAEIELLLELNSEWLEASKKVVLKIGLQL
ncbi:MAG: type VI secretion system contractile sheath large subunit [Acidobacteriaceae bacterium]|nr:type VI secretion system contractile sheath large subunit [Acidobacteriaceae bacterium]MBV9296401.1 type VI secretion system contractile sheath large subunit [Acidobacteriaceae bacterium]MBV9764387.1 type VI secretion system contractile sheath large subunit [Acidobacteriaceae bacterium]